MRKIFAILITAMIFAGSFSALAVIAETDCLAWANARPVIASKSLIPVKAIRQLVRNRIKGQMIHANLCRSGDKFIYKLVFLSPTGQVKNVTVDAQTGRF